MLKLVALGTIAVSAVVAAEWTFAFDAGDYEYVSFEFFNPYDSGIKLLLECPDGYQGRSAEDAAQEGYRVYSEGLASATAIGQSNRGVTVSDIRNVGRQSTNLISYVENDLKCSMRFDVDMVVK